MAQHTKQQFKDNRYIICLGEDAKYDFAKELIDYPYTLNIFKENLRQKMLYIHHKAETLKEKDKDSEEGLYMPSSLIPYKSIVHVPNSNRIDKEYIGEKVHTKIYIFEQYPYGKDTTKSLLESYEDEYPWAEIKVVLWQDDRRFGATDVSDEMVAVKMAQRRFEQIKPNCTILKNEMAFKELFYTQFQYTLQLGKAYETYIGDLKQNMNGIFEDYYYFEVESILEDEFLNLQQLDKYCRYDAIKNMDDLWQGYCYRFQKDALKKDGMIFEMTYALYEKLIQDVCYWDLQKDRESLQKEIEQHFYKNVVLKKPKTKPYKKPKNEMEYRLYMAKEPIDVRFKEKIQSFIRKDLKHCIAHYIEIKLRELEK